MKKKIFIFFTALIIIALTIYSYDRFSYSEKYSYPLLNAKIDTTFTIALIGDSWIAGKKLDTLIYSYLLNNNIKINVLSSGQPGAKSKLIYQNLFKDNKDAFSSKFILQNKPDYCIVVAGVNDAAGQCGAAFYSHHMLLIIQTLLHYKIKPIICELPLFGIIETNAELSFIKRIRNYLFALFTNDGNINNIDDYRKYFYEELKKEKLLDSIIYIPFKNICTNYSNCEGLYANPSHLSQKGNEVFAKEIVNYLISERRIKK